MASLACRIALRSPGLHRNLVSHVSRGQLRHIHETAAKPVFRWEVRIRSPSRRRRFSLYLASYLGPFGA
jgi:hypothetical protein